MPAAEFPNIPPFPDTVPTAPLLRISLAKLLAKEEEEEERFWKACCDLGFFYLDLRSPQELNGHTNGHSNSTNGHTNGEGKGKVDGDSLLKDADALFKVAEEFFALPVEEKAKYDFASEGSYFGYKGYGSTIIDQKGTQDRNEFYNVSKDDILAVSPALPAPTLFTKHRPLLSSYIRSSHALISLILSLLTPRLGLDEGKLESLHRLLAVSGDQVRFVKAPPQPPSDRRTALGAHTDFGSVTVLFNRVGGLQVRLPSTISPTPPAVPDAMTPAEKELTRENWTYVHPLPGHAIINLGDALVKFSSGKLRSNTHRVVSPPGEQGDVVRYSLVYFSRPEDDVVLRSIVGGEGGEEGMTSKEWILRRALGRRAGGKVDFEGTKGTEDVRDVKR